MASRYHLHLSAKTKILNFFRRFFLVTGTDKFLAKLTRHKSPNSFFGRLTPPNYLYAPGTFRNFNLDGINFSLDLSDTVGHGNYFGLKDEGHEVLYSLVKKGMTIFDIGANIGSTTLNFAKLTGSEGAVFSFEPDPTNFSRASKNISLNNFSNIRIFNKGLGQVKEQVFLQNVNEYNRGMLRVSKEPAADYPLSAIEVERLDDLVSEVALPVPDLIKIDVEGYEMNVLKGAKDTIQKHKPILFIELDDENLKEQDSSASELVGFLEVIGYQVKNAANKSPINSKQDFKNCHIDIICR